MLDTNFWKKYFEVYDFLNILEPYQKLLGAFVEMLGDVRGKKILDAGAGMFNLVEEFIRRILWWPRIIPQ